MVRNSIILFIQVLILILLTFELISVPGQLSSVFLSKILFFVFISVLVFAFRNEPIVNLKKQYVRISILFLLGFIIVHFQVYLEYILDNYRSFGTNLMINERIVPRASVVSAMGLVAFFIGYQYSTIRKAGLFVKTPESFTATILSEKGLFFLIMVLFSLMLSTANWAYFNGNYGEVSIGSIAAYGQEFLIISIVAYFVIFTRNQRVKGIRFGSFLSFIKELGLPFLAVVIGYLALVVLSGDRDPLLQIGMTFIGSYTLLAKRKIRLPVIVLSVIVVATFISVLGFVREMDNTGSFLDKIERANQVRSESSIQSSISPATLELAGSVRTMHGAVDYVQSNGHTRGLFQAFQAVSIIPGLGTIIKAITGLSNESIKSSSLLTRHISGSEITRGLGTTVVADLYLDFGVIGVLVGLFLFAWFVRHLETRAYVSSLFKISTLCLFFVFLPQAIYIGRSTILILFGDALMLFVVVNVGIYLNVLFGGKRIKAI